MLEYSSSAVINFLIESIEDKSLSVLVVFIKYDNSSTYVVIFFLSNSSISCDKYLRIWFSKQPYPCLQLKKKQEEIL